MQARLGEHRDALVLEEAIRVQLQLGAGHLCLFSWDASGDARRVAMVGEVRRDQLPDGAAEKWVDLELDVLARGGSQWAARASLAAPCKPDAGRFAARSFLALAPADGAELPVVESDLRRALAAAEPEARSAAARWALPHSSGAAPAAVQLDSLVPDAEPSAP